MGQLKRKIDLMGKTFGKLVVTGTAESRQSKAMWYCTCACGKVTLVYAESLLRDKTRSCGCLRTENHYSTHRMTGSKEYNIWANMKKRCLNPKEKRYPDYGGRGILVCTKWLEFQGFYEDMGDCPQDCSLDRRDNDLGYSPDNCRWVNNSIQRINQRRSSGIQGLTYKALTGKWMVRIGENGERKYLGVYSDWFEAVCARKSAEAKSEYADEWRN